MNLAALDLGSNSFHLLVARMSAGGGVTKLASHKEVLKLGGVVQAHGHLPRASFESASEAVGKMVAVARAFRAERLVAVGTSALRDAANGPEFCEAMRERFHLPVELMSGEEEGQVVYRGVQSAFPNLRGRVAVLDLGGGSVELAVGDGQRASLVESLPLGFLRLGQRLKATPGGSQELLTSWVQAESAEVRERLRWLKPDAWVLSGGTARAFGKLVLSGASGLSAATVRRVSREVSQATTAELLTLGVDPTRVDTLGLGVLVLDALVSVFGIASLRISPRGIREGLLLREVDRMGPAALGRLSSEPSQLVG